MSETDIAFRRYGKQPADSGVTDVCIREDSLIVRFRNGDIYLYDAERPGPVHVARMLLHARAGRGLASYISRHVGSNYARKIVLPAAKT
jgi:hypothetical protein